MMQEISLFGTYCDDIRQEVGGKLSLIGCYSGEMLFPHFPATLPKICVQILLKFPPTKRPTKYLSVELLKDEETLAKAELNEEALSAIPIPEEDSDIPIEDRYLGMPLGFVVAMVQFDAPCRLRLRATVDEKIVKGNGCKVRVANQTEMAQNGWVVADGNEKQAH
jgi:hypothetical protein